jgi:hypothetical protein
MYREANLLIGKKGKGAEKFLFRQSVPKKWT